MTTLTGEWYDAFYLLLCGTTLVHEVFIVWLDKNIETSHTRTLSGTVFWWRHLPASIKNLVSIKEQRNPSNKVYGCHAVVLEPGTTSSPLLLISYLDGIFIVACFSMGYCGHIVLVARNDARLGVLCCRFG